MPDAPPNADSRQGRGWATPAVRGLSQGEISKRLEALECEHEQALAALERSEGRYRGLLDAAFDLICEVDEDRRFTFVNPTFERLLGLRPQDLIGTQLEDRIHPEDRVGVCNSYRNVLEGHGGPPQLFRFRSGDGTWRWLEASGRRQLAADGRRSIVAICRDVSSRVALELIQARRTQGLEREVAARSARLRRLQQNLEALEKRVIQAERLDAAGELAGRIAHAIGTPLSALIGTVQMKLEATTGPDPCDERVLALARRIDRVVRGMLDLSRRGELKLSELAAGPLLDELRASVMTHAAESIVELDLSVAADAPRIQADHALVLAAIEAMIENAIDASPRGGTVALRARAVGGGRALEISIVDEGPGISSALIDHIFDPFFTTKPTGTGLGLAIALGIVRGHGGRIRIERVGGPGTVVRVELPAQVRTSAGSPSRSGL